MNSVKIILAPLEYIYSCVSIKVVILLVAGYTYYVINDPSARRQAVRGREREQNMSPGELKALFKNATAEIKLGKKEKMFVKFLDNCSAFLSAVTEESVSFIARMKKEEASESSSASTSSTRTATDKPKNIGRENQNSHRSSAHSGDAKEEIRRLELIQQLDNSPSFNESFKNVSPKSQSERIMIEEAIHKPAVEKFLLSSLSNEEIDLFIGALQKVNFQARDVILCQGGTTCNSFLRKSRCPMHQMY
jgi:hypothetical protein